MNAFKQFASILCFSYLLTACFNDPLPRPRPEPPTGNTKTRAYASGKVQGIVIDAETKAPIAGASITYDAYYSRPFEPYFDAFLISGTVPGNNSKGTNQQGEFSFSYSYPSVLNSPDAISFEFEISCGKAGYTPFFRVFPYSIDNRSKRDTVNGGTYRIEVILEK